MNIKSIIFTAAVLGTLLINGAPASQTLTITNATPMELSYILVQTKFAFREGSKGDELFEGFSFAGRNWLAPAVNEGGIYHSLPGTSLEIPYEVESGIAAYDRMLWVTARKDEDKLRASLQQRKRDKGYVSAVFVKSKKKIYIKGYSSKGLSASKGLETDNEARRYYEAGTAYLAAECNGKTVPKVQQANK